MYIDVPCGATHAHRSCTKTDFQPMSEWTYHRAFPYSDSLRKERTVRVWTSHAHRSDHRRPVQTGSIGLGPKAGAANEAFLQLPGGPPSPRRPLRDASSSWTEHASTPVWRKESRPNVNKAQLARLGTGPKIMLAGEPPKVLPPVNHNEIAKQGPFVEFFLQRPIHRKAVVDSIPSARATDLAARKKLDAAKLRRETERLNDSLRFLESIGLSPRRMKPPAKVDILVANAADEEYEEGEERVAPSSRLAAMAIQKGYAVRPSARPSSASSQQSFQQSLSSRPSSSHRRAF